MNSELTPSVSDLRVRKRGGLVAVVVVAALAAAVGGYLVLSMLGQKRGAKGCDRLVELALVDVFVAHVESRVVTYGVTSKERVRIEATGLEERCQAGMNMLAEAMPHGQFTRFVECLAAASTERTALRCF